jgi:hypothetical protein
MNRKNMPYVIVKSTKGNVHGYRVRKQERDPETGKFHYFSKHPISLEMAKKQLAALHIHSRE